MCMKNVNASIFFCSDIDAKEGNVNSLLGVYDSIVPTREENSYYLDNFNLSLNCSIMFDDKFVGQSDCIQLGETYEYLIRLTHVESGLGIQLYSFDLKIERENLKTWCKDFYEFKRFLKFPKFEIPKGLGNYAVKLFIRKKSDQDEAWNNQTIHSLIIGDSR